MTPKVIYFDHKRTTLTTYSTSLSVVKEYDLSHFSCIKHDSKSHVCNIRMHIIYVKSK